MKLPGIYQKLVNDKKLKNWQEGKSTFGNKNNKKLSKKQIQEAALQFITKQKTMTQLAEELGVSRTTLFEQIFTVDILGETIYWNMMQQKEERKYRKGK